MKLLKNKVNIIFIILLVVFVTLVEDVVGERYIANELDIYVKESLKERAELVKKTIELEQELRLNLRDVKKNLEYGKQQIHGYFLQSVFKHYKNEYLSGNIDRQTAERKIESLLSEINIQCGLKYMILKMPEANQNYVDNMIKKELIGEDEAIVYTEDKFSTIYTKEFLKIEIRKLNVNNIGYSGQLIYFKPFDWIIVLREMPQTNANPMRTIYKISQGKMKFKFEIASLSENIYFVEDRGYVTSSITVAGSKYKNLSIDYSPLQDSKGILNQVKGLDNTYKTLLLKDKDSQYKRHKSYIIRNSKSNQYIVITMKEDDIKSKKGELLKGSRLINMINIFLVIIISMIVVRFRQNTIEEEKAE